MGLFSTCLSGCSAVVLALSLSLWEVVGSLPIASVPERSLFCFGELLTLPALGQQSYVESLIIQRCYSPIVVLWECTEQCGITTLLPRWPSSASRICSVGDSAPTCHPSGNTARPLPLPPVGDGCCPNGAGPALVAGAWVRGQGHSSRAVAVVTSGRPQPIRCS